MFLRLFDKHESVRLTHAHITLNGNHISSTFPFFKISVNDSLKKVPLKDDLKQSLLTSKYMDSWGRCSGGWEATVCIAGWEMIDEDRSG